MPTISPADLDLLRTNDSTKVVTYISIHTPLVTWEASVDGTPARESETLTFSGGSGLDFSLILQHQTVIVHHSDGQEDETLRIKSISSGDAGVTGTLVVNGNGIYWTGGETLSFTYDYQVWGVFPFLKGTPQAPIFTKDWDLDGGITYTNQNDLIPPIAIAGSNRAGFLTGPSLTFDVPVDESYAVADGATIVSKVVTVYPMVGVTINPEALGVIGIEYTQEGQYWIKLLVTDSNGVTQDTYRLHFVHSTDVADPNYPLVGYDTLSVTGDWNGGGWSASVSFHDDVSFPTIPNDAQAIVWQDATYGATNKGISGVVNSPEVLISGYVRRDKFTINPEEGGSAEFSIETVSYLMENRFMFSLSLESRTSPAEWWQYKNGQLTPGKIVHNIYRWHSTLCHVTDLINITANPDDRFAIDIDKATIQQQAMQTVADYGIIARMVCDKAGRLLLSEDITIEEDAYRDALPIAAKIEQEDSTGEITIVHSPENTVAFVFFSGFSYDGTTATPVGSTAPSTWPDQRGATDMMVERQVIRDQNQSNEMAGQIRAKHNNDFPEVRVDFHGNYLGVLEPAFEEWWTMDVDIDDTIRRIVWVDKKMVCRQVTANYDIASGSVSVNAVFETEPDGVPGVPYQWPGINPEVGGGTDPVPGDPDYPGGSENTFGDVLVTAASISKMGAGAGVWSIRHGPNIQDVDADINTLGDPDTTEMYACGVGNLQESVDGGTTWDAMAGIPEPPNSFSDTPAPELVDIIFEQYEGDIINTDILWFSAKWQNISDEWRSWLLEYNKDTTSWTWNKVSDPTSSGPISGYSAHSVTSPHMFPSGDGQVLIVYRNSSTLNISAKVYLGGDSYGPEVQSSSNFNLLDVSFSSGKFLVYLSSIPTKVLVGTVSGTAITFGTEVNIPTSSRGNNSSAPHDMQILSSTNGLLVHAYNATNGGNPSDDTGFGYLAIEIAGVVPSFPGVWEYERQDLEDIERIEIAPTGGQPVLVWHRIIDVVGPSGYPCRMYSTIGDIDMMDGTMTLSGVVNLSTLIVSGNSLYVAYNGDNSPDVTYTAFADVIDLGDDNFTDSFLFAFATSEGDVIAGSPVIIQANDGVENALSFVPNFIVDDEVRFVYLFQGAEHFMKVNNNNSSLGRSLSEICILDGVSGGQIEAVPMTQQLISYWGSIGVSRLILGCATSADEGEIIGFDIEKTSGSSLYLTLRGSDGGIYLQRYSTSSVSFELSVKLTDATDSDFNKRRIWAYPMCPYGADAVFVYGRMDIGNNDIVHILLSQDGGETFLTLEDGWSIDHCASIVQDINDYIYIVRCSDVSTPVSPKVYELVEGNVIFKATINTLIFGVNPRGVKAGFSGDLYLCSNRPNSIMVAETYYPFTQSYNITADHQIVRGIKAVAVI